MSRPTKVTEAVIKDIIQAGKWGATIKEAAAYVGITEKTLHNHFNKNEELLQRFNEAREQPILAAKKKVVDELPKDTKNAQWYLSKKKANEFGDKLDITSDGDKIQPVLVEFMVPVKKEGEE